MNAIIHPAFPIQFYINQGGIGDFIYMVVAITYCIENYSHISGTVVAPHFFYDYAVLWLKKYAPRFRVLKSPDFDPHIPILEPRLHGCQPNAAGFHLLETAFQQFNNSPIPPGWFKMPEINGDEADISRFNLPEEYVVITTEATAENRRLEGQAVNELADYLLDVAKVPMVVYLGKNKIAGGYSSTSPVGCKFRGKDLRNKTYPLEAAAILAKAKCVIGLDNGLLHLAACSMVPVVAAFSNVNPKTRMFYRRPGALTYIVVPPEGTCRYCFTQERFTSQSADYCYTARFDCTKSITGESLIKGYEAITKGSHNDN